MIKEATPDDHEVLAKIIRDSFRDVARRFSLTKDNCPKHPFPFKVCLMEFEIKTIADHASLSDGNSTSVNSGDPIGQ